LVNSFKKWFFDPEVRIVSTIYFCHRMYAHGGLRRKLSGITWRFFVTEACNISPYARIGRNLHLPHPVGIVIGPKAEIGDDVLIYQNVTLGRRHAGQPGSPKIMDNTVIYAGAVLVGGITVGPCATIGANSVVFDDVPPHTIVVGAPARPV
jgi:serine O-acetyltransferase